jgi:DNA-binding IscR family transcriptional regulator
MTAQLETPTFSDRRLTIAAVLRALESDPCRVQGCTNRTSGHKPYCIRHLTYLPYVRSLRSELAHRDAEASAATCSRSGELDSSGTRAEEIVEVLGRRGPQTLERLAATLRIPARAVESYVQVLSRAGLVQTIRLASRCGGFRRLVTRKETALKTAS